MYVLCSHALHACVSPPRHDGVAQHQSRGSETDLDYSSFHSTPKLSSVVGLPRSVAEEYDAIGGALGKVAASSSRARQA